MMQSAARVLVVGDADKGDQKFLQNLESNGFEGVLGDIRESAAEIAGQRQPDIIVLNMACNEAQQDPKPFFALAQTLKQSNLSSRMRILMIGADNGLELNESIKDIDDLLPGPVKYEQVCHRLRSLVRLNTMHEELVRRLNTTAKYGFDAPDITIPSPQIESARVLFVGEALSYSTVENALSKKATLIGALTFATAMDYLARENFDAILVDAGSQQDDYISFVEDIRRNSQLFNIPVLMISSFVSQDITEKAYEAGVTDLIARSFNEAELAMRASVLIREYRFRNSLRHIYLQAKHFATNDSLTGLYSRGFLLEHLAQIIADATRTSQTFSIAAFSIYNMAQLNKDHGYAMGDRIIRQVGEMIGVLVRGEDVAARYSGPHFIVGLPDTSASSATYALQRICGVIHNTEFAINGLNEAISITLNTKIAAFERCDTPEKMIKRVLK